MVAIIQPPVYILKITLEESTPPVFRQVKVRSNVSLDILHQIIQESMGWHDCHPHQYILAQKYYGTPDPLYDEFDMEMLNERDFTLGQLAPKKGSKLKYEYDFGDSWIHLIKVVQVIADDPGFTHPECLSGENACPPEDVGGVWGYAEVQETLKNPKHKDYKDLRKWVGPQFAPSAFDLEKTNAALKRL